jgi:glycosyltransferase involved in cell wall biosynthesis
MRVTLVGTYYTPFVGGIETHMAHLATALRDAGIRVTVACLFDPPRLGPSLVSVREGISVRQVGAYGWGETVFWAGRLIPPDSTDLIHFHGFSRPVLVRSWLDGRPAPIVITPHGGLRGVVTDPVPMRRALKTAFDRVAGRAIIRRAARIVALTDQEGDHLVSQFNIKPTQIAIMPNPLPDNAFRVEDIDQGASGRLLVLSRLAPEKRIGDLIAAIGLMSSPVGCDIAGPDAGEEHRLRQLAARLPIGTVRFVGQLNGEAKARALRGAKALVLASSAEGLSISALEAIDQGTPVVVADSASAGLPRTACLIYPVGDLTAMAKCLDSLNLASIVSELRQGAALCRETFVRVPEYARAMIHIYQEALASRRTGDGTIGQ